MLLRYLVKALWGQTAPKGFAKERVVTDPVPSSVPLGRVCPSAPQSAQSSR